MTVANDLRAAKAVIDTPEKWRKDGDPEHDDCCAIVATYRIPYPDSGRRGRYAMWEALFNALPRARKNYRCLDECGFVVGDFNDDPDTTHADIMDLFQRAIDAEEAKAGGAWWPPSP